MGRLEQSSTLMIHSFKKRRRDLLLDAVVGAGWLAFAGLYVRPVLQSGGLIDWGRLLFLFLLVALFIMRDSAQKSGAAWESGLAFVGTLLPVAILRPAGGGPPLLGESLQVIGLAGTLAAGISLGRGFGIAPADRGLRTRGLYRWIRHPLYAAEICFYVGYLVANPTLRNMAGLTMVTVIQVIRIGREERILDGYASYAHRVRYRLVPFVW